MIAPSATPVAFSEYCAAWRAYFEITLEPPYTIANIGGTTPMNKIAVKRALRMKPVVNAATKYANDCKNSPAFSEVPSWIVCVSAVRRVAI